MPVAYPLNCRIMKILIVHNSYQHQGGEDTVVEAEAALLRRHGVEVDVYRRHNDELQQMSRAKAALSSIWSHESASEAEQRCRKFQPDIIHVHNTFPLISPSLYWMAERLRIPVVQTLHNYRFVCPQAMFLRDGKVCEDCVGKMPWRAIVHKCYRDSAMQSAVSVSMLAAHRAIGTYRERITRFIALSHFSREKFIAGGLPANRISVKPNFFVSRDVPQWEERQGGMFAGRLSFEKGLDVLSGAARLLESCAVKVVGKGPLEQDVKQVFQSNYLGFRPQGQLIDLLRKALYLVAPSTCYENFPLVVVEAFANGTPVIASRHGSFAELVKDGVTGLLFTPGDAADLATRISWADAHPEEMKRMGQAARKEYETRYTPERNYQLLSEIYRQVLMQEYGEKHAA